MRALIGKERTRARRALAVLSALHPSAEQLARALGMKRHSIAPCSMGERAPSAAFSKRRRASISPRKQ